MSESTTPAVDLDRIAEAVRRAGLLPFIAGDTQVAAILPSRVMRIVVPGHNPPQGIAEWSRALNIRFAPDAALFARTFNATTYLPKMVTAVTDQGDVHIRFQHTFNWVGGASESQVREEVRQFVLATLGAFDRLEARFPDTWASGADDV